MKRVAWIVALALAVGFAAGAAARGKRFAYLSDELNRKVDLTEIELACIKGRFTAQRALEVRPRRIAVTEIRATPRSSHIHLEVEIELTAPARDPVRLSELEYTCAAVYKVWRERLLKRDVPEAPRCPVTIDLRADSKVRFRQIHDSKGTRGFENPQI